MRENRWWKVQGYVYDFWLTHGGKIKNENRAHEKRSFEILLRNEGVGVVIWHGLHAMCPMLNESVRDGEKKEIKMAMRQSRVRVMHLQIS